MASRAGPSVISCRSVISSTSPVRPMDRTARSTVLTNVGSCT